MDNKKIGEFICNLRKAKNLSQYDLADKIHISRESISKWERGIGKPDKNCIQELSKIFGVSTDELILGKRIENKKESESLTLNLYEDLNKNKKMVLLMVIIIFILSFLFLLYYFFNNYNSIHAYIIDYSDDTITIDNGIFLTTKEKMYFSLGDITSKREINYIKLFFKDKNNKEKLIYQTDGKDIVLHDYYGYNNFFKYSDLKNITKNLYLDISLEASTNTIKLNVTPYFSNDLLHYEKGKPVTEKMDNKINNEKIIDIDKIEKQFKKEDNIYTYIKGNVEITYLKEMNLINININENNNREEWIYYIDENMLSYTEYENDNVTNSFDFYEYNFKCLINKCSNEEEKTKEFYNILYKSLS